MNSRSITRRIRVERAERDGVRITNRDDGYDVVDGGTYKERWKLMHQKEMVRYTEMPSSVISVDRHYSSVKCNLIFVSLVRSPYSATPLTRRDLFYPIRL